jgi:hypothetical protein
MSEEVKAPKKEKIPRQKMPEQEPKIRARNFEEVPFGYTPELAMREAERCTAPGASGALCVARAYTHRI